MSERTFTLTQVRYIQEDGTLSAPSTIYVKDGKIEQILPAACPTPSIHSQGPTYDCSEGLLAPGFFNAHSHIPMTYFRGIGEGLPLQRWLVEKIFPLEAQLEPEDVYWASKLGIAEMLATGTVSFSDMYMNMDQVAQACLETGILANLSVGMTSDQGKPVEDHRSYPQILQLREIAAKTQGQVRCDLSLHAEYTSDPTLAESLASLALRLGKEDQDKSGKESLGQENMDKSDNKGSGQEDTAAQSFASSVPIIQIHVSETAREHEECKQRHGGKTPLEYLFSLGYDKVPLLLAHCVHLEDRDYDLLRQVLAEGAQISLCHNPRSNLKLGSGIADLVRWLSIPQLNVCLGTDGASSNNSLDMQKEASLMALLQKGFHEDASALPLSQILQIATSNGAQAQGRLDTGLIREGMWADFVLWPTTRPFQFPYVDDLSNLFYADPGRPELVFIRGQRVYDHRSGQATYPTMDLEEVLAECKKRFRGLMDRAAQAKLGEKAN